MPDLRSILPRIVIVLALSTPRESPAQFAEQGEKLVGAGAAGYAAQGIAVALSADGNTAIIGGNTDQANRGAAWVYVRNAGVWTQQGPKLSGTGAVGSTSRFGSAVSLSADGNTALIGAPGDSNNYGAVWVFTRSAGGWTQMGQKLVGAGGDGAPHQGMALSLSGDGMTAVVGGPVDGYSPGSVWVFTRTMNGWTQQGGKLRPNDPVGGSGNFGRSVSVSADGTRLVAGAPSDGTVGAAWVFGRDGGVWTQSGAKLVRSGGVHWSPSLGFSVAMSGDGLTVVLGEPEDSSGIGGAYTFTNDESYWVQRGEKIRAGGTFAYLYSYQGSSVALSGDGSTLIEGGIRDGNSRGAAWAFTRSGNSWIQPGEKLVGGGPTADGLQGSAVAISSDGTTVIVGGPWDNAGTGAAWVFYRNSTGVMRTGESKPEFFSLEQNFPNPFNPRTTIRVMVANRRATIVRVYDVVGREIATLMDEVKDPGTYDIPFDGATIASGVYFCRMTAGDFSQIRALHLIR